MPAPRLAVVDYGGGNIGSLLSALARRNVDAVLTDDPAIVARADAAILPGDGAFGATMTMLAERGLDAAVREFCAAGKPFLGICVGMQILFEDSDEYGIHAGLGLLPGRVSRFKRAPRVPHMGWNDLQIERAHPFIAGLVGGEYFSAIVARDNLMATQFHPEKSARTGGLLLDNFLRIAAA